MSYSKSFNVRNSDWTEIADRVFYVTADGSIDDNVVTVTVTCKLTGRTNAYVESPGVLAKCVIDGSVVSHPTKYWSGLENTLDGYTNIFGNGVASTSTDYVAHISPTPSDERGENYIDFWYDTVYTTKFTKTITQTESPQQISWSVNFVQSEDGANKNYLNQSDLTATDTLTVPAIPRTLTCVAETGIQSFKAITENPVPHGGTITTECIPSDGYRILGYQGTGGSTKWKYEESNTKDTVAWTMSLDRTITAYAGKIVKLTLDDGLSSLPERDRITRVSPSTIYCVHDNLTPSFPVGERITPTYYTDYALTNEIKLITTLPERRGYTYNVKSGFVGDGSVGGEDGESYIAYGYSGILDTWFATDLCIDIDADATLTCSWTPKTYTVVYKGNGGSWNNTDTWSNTATYDTWYDVEPNFYTRPGYKFVGWTTNSDGSYDNYGWTRTSANGTVDYWGGDWTDAEGSCGVDANCTLTLYAMWEPLATIYVKHSDGKFKPGIPYVKDGSSWKKAVAVYVKTDEGWKLSTR